MSNKINIILIGAIVIFIAFLTITGIFLYFTNQNYEIQATNIDYPKIIKNESILTEDVLIPKEILPEEAPSNLDNLILHSAIAIDMESNQKIFSIRENEKWVLASIVKIMSAIVALENMDLAENVIFSESAIASLGNRGNFLVGESFTVKDLINAMMVFSSNDASIALMEKMPDGQFIALMNEKAKKIGMHSTQFVEPSGIYMLNQGTANDLVLLINYVWANHRYIFDISKENYIELTELNNGRSISIRNTNQLAFRNDFLGGKTGFTNAARENLVSTFTINNRPIMIIILGAENRLQELEKIIYYIKYDTNSIN